MDSIRREYEEKLAAKCKMEQREAAQARTTDDWINIVSTKDAEINRLKESWAEEKADLLKELEISRQSLAEAVTKSHKHYMRAN